MRFEVFKKVLWRKADYLALSTDARLLFLWSWTNPDVGACGLYRASVRQLEDALGESPGAAPARERVGVALRELAEKPHVLYDDEAEVLWVVAKAKHADRSEAARDLMRREARRCPPTPLKDEFRRLYDRRLELS